MVGAWWPAKVPSPGPGGGPWRLCPPGSGLVFKSTSASPHPAATTRSRQLLSLRPCAPPPKAHFGGLAARGRSVRLGDTVNKVDNCVVMNLLDVAQRPPGPAVALGVQRVEATNLTQSMWPLWLCITRTSLEATFATRDISPYDLGAEGRLSGDMKRQFKTIVSCSLLVIWPMILGVHIGRLRLCIMHQLRRNGDKIIISKRFLARYHLSAPSVTCLASAPALESTWQCLNFPRNTYRMRGTQEGPRDRLLDTEQQTREYP